MRFSGGLRVAAAIVLLAGLAAPLQAQSQPSRTDIARHSLSMDVWLPLLSGLPGTVMLTANYDLRLASWFAVRTGLVVTVPELLAVPFGQAVFLLGGRGHYLELGLGAWPWATLAMATVSYRYQAVDRGGPVFRAGFTPGMMFVPLPFVGAGYSFPPRRPGSARSRQPDLEDGVLLTVESQVEDAAVFADGQFAGNIRDGHLTMITSGVILFWLGTSIVQGFALVFVLGVLASFISAVALSRVFLLAIVPEEGRGAWHFLLGSGFRQASSYQPPASSI